MLKWIPVLLLSVPQTDSAVSKNCDYATAFAKGQADITSGSYGADLDRYCSAQPEAEREAFKKAYEAGRNAAKDFKELNLMQTPKDEDEKEKLLKEGKEQKEKKDLQEEVKKQKLQIERLKNRTQVLESDKMRLEQEKKAKSGVQKVYP